MLVIGQRQRIVENTDSKEDEELEDDHDIGTTRKLPGPSEEAIAKFTDYCEY